MTTSFTESTYAAIAADLSQAAINVDKLATVSNLIRSQFTENGSLTQVGQKLLTLTEAEMASLTQKVEGFSHLLQAKLDEPVDEKFGFGQYSAQLTEIAG